MKTLCCHLQSRGCVAKNKTGQLGSALPEGCACAKSEWSSLLRTCVEHRAAQRGLSEGERPLFPCTQRALGKSLCCYS